MNKKNISLVLLGILFIAMQFTIKNGPVTIDIFSDIIAYILIIVGVCGLCNRSRMFKKARVNAIIGLIISIAVQILLCFDLGTAEFNLQLKEFTLAFSTIFAIYFTYYFNEAVILESRFQEKLAVTRNLRMVWTGLGIMLFVNYLVLYAVSQMMTIIVQAVTLLMAFYYCGAVYNACKQLYTDEMPNKN